MLSSRPALWAASLASPSLRILPREGVEYIAGHPNWFAFIDEWAVPVHVQDLNGSSKYIGASAVKGRKVYAFKVTKPQTILIKKKA